MSAITYSRVSSREQQQEGFFLGAQAKLLREHADRNDMTILKAFQGDSEDIGPEAV